jgi:hypothetical protein
MSDRNAIPVTAQLAVVNKMVLPLLDKMNISVTVTTKPEGMLLDLRFTEPTAAPQEEHVFGTDSPETARQMWALREKIEQYRRDHPELDAD